MEIQARAEQFNATRPAGGFPDRTGRIKRTAPRTWSNFPTEDLELLFDMAMSDYRPLSGARPKGRRRRRRRRR